MRNALIAIGVLVLGGFIVTQALAWNGNWHQGHGPINSGMHGQAVNNHQGWSQGQAGQNRAMGSGNAYQQGSQSYQHRSPGYRQHTTGQNVRGYGNRGHGSGPAQGYWGNGYCR